MSTFRDRLQCSFCGRNRTGRSRVELGCHTQCATKCLENGFTLVMRVFATEIVDMQRYFCVIDESLKKFTNQIQIEGAGRGAHEWNLKFQIGASREIDHDSGQGFIQRNISMAVTADTALVADSLCQSLSDGDTV